MSHLRAHRLLSVAMQRLERGEKPKRILHAIKGAVEDLQDPFAGEIDEFLREKQRINMEDPNDTLRQDPANDNTPQEKIEDKMEDLSEKDPSLKDEMPGDSPQEAPQKKAEIKYKTELEDSKEEDIDELEDQKQEIEKEIEKVKKRDEEYAESALREIAKIAQERGYPALANKFIAASLGGVTDILNDLLMHEYLQRDIFVNYVYLFDDGSHVSYMKQHFESEKNRMLYLQKAIIELGGTPTTNRLTIPPVNPMTSESVMGLIKELEKQAVTEYLAAAQSLEQYSEHIALRVWLENIAVEEDVDTKEMEALK